MKCTNVFLFVCLLAAFILGCKEVSAPTENKNLLKVSSDLLNANLLRYDDEFYKGTYINYDGFISFNHEDESQIISINEDGGDLLIRVNDSGIESIRLTNFTLSENGTFLFNSKDNNGNLIVSIEFWDEDLESVTAQEFKNEIQTMLIHSNHRVGGWCLGGAAIAAALYGGYAHCNSVVSTGTLGCLAADRCAEAGFCSVTCVTCPPK